MSDPGTTNMPSARALLVALILLVCFAVQASIAARRDSVTIDEFVHLPVGLYALYTGDLRSDPINPPHTRQRAGIPAALRPWPHDDHRTGGRARGCGFLVVVPALR
jgi:hypothetical protein